MSDKWEDEGGTFEISDEEWTDADQEALEAAETAESAEEPVKEEGD